MSRRRRSKRLRRSKSKLRVFSIEDPVFKCEPVFITDCSYEEMRQWIRKRWPQITIDEAPEFYAGTMFTFECPPWRLVYVRRSRELGVWVHEILHLVTRICQDKGIPIVRKHPNGDSGDETVAYMMEFYIEGILKKRRLKKLISV